MSLKPRGDDTPKPSLGDDAAKAFGLGDDFDHGDTPEEALAKLREIGGEGAVSAARLSIQAIAAYDTLETNPGDEEALRNLYETIDALANLPGANLRTVLVTGIVAIHTLRKQGGM